MSYWRASHYPKKLRLFKIAEGYDSPAVFLANKHAQPLKISGEAEGLARDGGKN
jgi:hypothetical protein